MLNCMTKINGVIYPAGAEVPVGDKAVAKNNDIKETVVKDEPKKQKQKVSKTTDED